MKITLHIEIDDADGVLIDRLARVIETIAAPKELPKPPPRRLEDVPPAVNLAPRRRADGWRR